MAVLEELGSKLTDIAGIKVSFPVQNDKDFILKIYARLCLLYDETWECGDTSFSLSCKKILRLLNRVGIAHLTPTSADVVDPRRLPRVWSAFIAHLEQKYGSQGLYPRLRKVLKQQQLLAARREAEKERQQRLAGSAASPGRPRLGDTSTCSSLSQDSQDDVRFAKPFPPAPLARHVSASSSGSSVSPSKGGIRSRIPLPTSRPNLIPTGKQLARTPCQPAKTAAPAASQPQVVTVFGSPRLVAPKAAAALAATAAAPVVVAPEKSDSGTSEGAGSPQVSPARRRSLIPAAKTPEQALGEYIESRLNAGFPQQVELATAPAAAAPASRQTSAASSEPSSDAETPAVAAPASCEPSTAPTEPSPDAAAPAAAETALNVTYSAERPAAAPRAAEQAPSPAADAREAILQAAGDADDKENVEPVPAEKTTGEGKASAAATERAVRRGTFEVTPAPASPQKLDVDVNGDVEKQPMIADKDLDNEERSELITKPAAGTVSDAESGPALKAAPVMAEGLVDPPLAQPFEEATCSASPEESASSAQPEEPAKKRRGRSKKGAQEPECTDEAEKLETQPEPPKKRGARGKKAKPVAEDPPAASEAVPAAEDSAGNTQESAADAPRAETREKRGARGRKAKSVVHDAAPATEAAPVVEPATGAGNSAETIQEPAADASKAEGERKRGGRAKKTKKAASEDVPSTDVVKEAADGNADEPAVLEPPPSDADPTEAPAEVPAHPPAVEVEEAPKKRRGRAKKEAGVVSETTEPSPQAAVGDEVQPEVVDSVPVDVHPEPAEPIKEEAPKKRRGRAKKDEKPIVKSSENEPAKPEIGPAAMEAASATEKSDNLNEQVEYDPAKGAEKEAPRKRRGRARESKTTSAAAEESTTESVADQLQAVEEPSEEAARPARASRRQTAVRTQKSTDSEATDDTSDPSWTPGEAADVAPGGRRGRTAARQTEAKADEVPMSESQVAARGRGRRTRHAEPPAESPEEQKSSDSHTSLTAPAPASDQLADPAGDQPAAPAKSTRRSTRGGRATPIVEPENPAPASRRRRLRVVLESDSEGGTPPTPACVDRSPSPAAPQRSRRPRKTAEGAGRPRRALRALENCE